MTLGVWAAFVPNARRAPGACEREGGRLDEEIRRLLQDQARELKALRREIAESRPARVDLTVAALWVDYDRASCTRPAWQSVRHLMKAPLVCFGDRRIDDLRRSDWTAYVEQRRQEQTRLRRPPSVGTLNLELKRLKALCNWGVAQERIGRNPFQGIRPERAPKPHRETEIGDDGLARLMAVCDPVMRALVLAAVDSGMRCGELRSLRWDRIDLRTGRVQLSAATTKTRRRRSPRLTERATEALRLLPRHVSSSYVFANPKTGRPYSYGWLWWRFRCAADEAELVAEPGDERVHLHDARHTFVSQAIRDGVQPPVVMRLAGMTLQTLARYLHVREEDLDDAKAILDGAERRGPQRAEGKTAQRRSEFDERNKHVR